MPKEMGKRQVRENQGNLWPDTGSEGNIHKLDRDGGTDKTPHNRGPTVSRKGLNLETGRHKGTRRASKNRIGRK